MTANPKRNKQRPAIIKLFKPEQSGEPPQGAIVPLPPNLDALRKLTMRQAYEQYLEPFQLERRAASTRSAYRTALNHWERCTANPAVSAITDKTISKFMKQMIESGVKGTQNLNKQWRALHSILSRLAQRGPKNPTGIPYGEHLVDYIPHWEPYPKRRKRIRVASRDNLSNCYRSCDVARWPNRGSLLAPIIWRTVYVLFYNYGPRTWDGFLFEWEQHLFFQAECPDPQITTLNELGWLCYTPKKTERTKPEPLILPLNAVTRWHLEMLVGHGPRVFPVSKSNRDVQATRALINVAAGIQVPYTFQELRATCNTTWDRCARGLGRHVLGHGARDVNSDSYLQIIDELCEVVHTLPQPDAFLEGMNG